MTASFSNTYREMSNLLTIQDNLGDYIIAHRKALAQTLQVNDGTTRCRAVLDHSLCLTQQLQATVASLDVAGALHTTFCQTINFLTAYRTEHEPVDSDLPDVVGKPYGQASYPYDSQFATLINASQGIRDLHPWLSTIYRRYCDELWSDDWNKRTPGEDQYLDADRNSDDSTANVLMDIACDFVQLTQALLDLYPTASGSVITP